MIAPVRLLLLISLIVPAATASAELTPDQIAIVVARGNRESRDVAKHYCSKRGVPEANLIEVDVTPDEELDREQWRWAVRPEIKKWLAENDPDRAIRCLVTTYGVPLKIGKAKLDAEHRAHLDFLRGERDRRLETLADVERALTEMGGGSAAVADTSQAEQAGSPKLKQRLEEVLRAAQVRLGSQSVEARRATEGRLQQLATLAGGAQVLLQGMNQQLSRIAQSGGEPNVPLKERFDVMRGRASAMAETRLLLDRQPPGFARDWMALRMIQATGGLLATIEWLEEQVKTAERNETGSSLDSELSLVLWSDGYELLRWQPNYLAGVYEGSSLRTAFPTLMVARLDGPTPEIAKRLVDDAVATEEAGGLRGKVYLDARGLATLESGPHQPGSYPDFDQSLLVTASGLERLEDAEGDPRFEVVLNELPDLFQPGDCPDAGLYCGWYSLAKYIDAFEWNRGAVAYHMASGEAATLRELDSQCWCKEMLRDGVAVTIGPVYEPYLVAFPRPSDFFAQLTQGRESLVETYYRTKPFGSWMMTLVGDPLYRPFGG